MRSRLQTTHPFLLIPAAIAVFAAMLTLLADSPERASASFPGTNGKIAFTSVRDGNFEIYGMNADGSGQTALTSHLATTTPRASPRTAPGSSSPASATATTRSMR